MIAKAKNMPNTKVRVFQRKLYWQPRRIRSANSECYTTKCAETTYSGRHIDRSKANSGAPGIDRQTIDEHREGNWR